MIRHLFYRHSRKEKVGSTAGFSHSNIPFQSFPLGTVSRKQAASRMVFLQSSVSLSVSWQIMTHISLTLFTSGKTQVLQFLLHRAMFESENLLQFKSRLFHISLSLISTLPCNLSLDQKQGKGGGRGGGELCTFP